MQTGTSQTDLSITSQNTNADRNQCIMTTRHCRLSWGTPTAHHYTRVLNSQGLQLSILYDKSDLGLGFGFGHLTLG